MEARLVLYILGVVLLVAGSLTAMADQSGRLVGVHEIPPFVARRVELPTPPPSALPARDRAATGDAAKPASAG